jgi:hypothetical protein
MDADERVVDDDGVVRIGSVVFALIRPTAGHEVDFNHWYGWDHYYTAGTAAPGVFSAGRFLQPDTGWHLALYFVLPGHDDARVAFATEQVAVAAAEDRVFAEREHLHTWSYAVESATVGVDGVPLSLALDHRYPSIDVAMYDGEPPAPVGPALTLRPIARIMPAEWDHDIDQATRRTVVSFGSADPATQDDSVIWTGRFLPMIFGTDAPLSS